MCGLFLGTHVFVDFVGVRAKIVRTPIAPSGGTVTATALPETLKELRAPFAVITRIRNDADAANRFVIRIDGQTVCDPVVAPHSTTRHDCALDREWNSHAPHEVTVQSSATSWALEYMELSTHDGSSSGLLTLFVLPKASPLYTPPGRAAIVASALVLFALLLLPAPPLSRRFQWLHRAAIVFVVLWMVVVALLPYVAPYRAIVSAGSFGFWITVLMLPRVVLFGGPAARRLVTSPARWAVIARPLLVAALVVVAFGAVLEASVHEFHGNYSGFLRLSRARVEANPILAGHPEITDRLFLQDNPGYDAQFMYAMTYDPLLTRFHGEPGKYLAYIDLPPYRYGRIGFSLLTRLLSFGQPNLYPLTMMLLICGSLGVLALVVGILARESGASVLWGLLVLLVPGFWTSLHVGLPEPVAAAALIGGYLCVRRERWLAAGSLFAVSMLIRETGGLLVFCIAASLFLSGRQRIAIKLAALSLTPLLVWRLYVGTVFHSEFGVVAFWNTPDDFALPFQGLRDLWAALHRGDYYPDAWEARRAGLGYSALIVGGISLAALMAAVSFGPISAAAAGYAVMTILFNIKSVWVHAGNAERLTCDLFLMLVVSTALLITSAPRRLRWLIYMFWMGSAAYMLFGTYDAQVIRGTLLPILW